MKQLLGIIVLAAMLAITPMVLATSIGTGVSPVINTEKFAPLVWMCDSRVVADDNVQNGRISAGGSEMLERINNYAFEGESVKWEILVMDKNGINKVQDVHATVGSTQGAGNDIEANCIEDLSKSTIDSSCNARIGEETLSGDINTATQRYYTCKLTVETPDSMHGQFWITAEATDLDGLMGTMAENEFWFFNPVIALSTDGGALTFDNVRPGTASYSSTLLLRNDAEDGSGVLMDMFISGTDFYDPASSGAMCPTTNQLALSYFRYFATHGAYSTSTDFANDAGTYDPATTRAVDSEGYVNIQHGDHWDKTMYNEAEILQAGGIDTNPVPGGIGGDSLVYYPANVVSPGAEMALTFKLSLPEPCNGDFSSGQIMFWGEAI